MDDQIDKLALEIVAMKGEIATLRCAGSDAATLHMLERRIQALESASSKAILDNMLTKTDLLAFEARMQSWMIEMGFIYTVLQTMFTILALFVFRS